MSDTRLCDYYASCFGAVDEKYCVSTSDSNRIFVEPSQQDEEPATIFKSLEKHVVMVPHRYTPVKHEVYLIGISGGVIINMQVDLNTNYI